MEEIVFEQADPPVTLAKGSVCSAEAVLENDINRIIEANPAALDE